ncbi:hypothetical protein AYI70_g7134 [Smittium culicis]|uniref:Uncharacterized protein n=1 Tax=Smittium culicis TaxID=133412 RepID=A0A1R1XM07_9FUNG|nr:hypothetical protein AYI70_g7134 [Smittium culicis]
MAYNTNLGNELEEVDLKITLMLQEIDANFDKCQRIVTRGILPKVTNISRGSRKIVKTLKPWLKFFDKVASTGNNLEKDSLIEITNLKSIEEKVANEKSAAFEYNKEHGNISATDNNNRIDVHTADRFVEQNNNEFSDFDDNSDFFALDNVNQNTINSKINSKNSLTAQSNSQPKKTDFKSLTQNINESYSADKKNRIDSFIRKQRQSIKLNSPFGGSDSILTPSSINTDDLQSTMYFTTNYTSRNESPTVSKQPQNLNSYTSNDLKLNDFDHSDIHTFNQESMPTPIINTVNNSHSNTNISQQQSVSSNSQNLNSNTNLLSQNQSLHNNFEKANTEKLSVALPKPTISNSNLSLKSSLPKKSSNNDSADYNSDDDLDFNEKEVAELTCLYNRYDNSSASNNASNNLFNTPSSIASSLATPQTKTIPFHRKNLLNTNSSIGSQVSEIELSNSTTNSNSLHDHTISSSDNPDLTSNPNTSIHSSHDLDLDLELSPPQLTTVINVQAYSTSSQNMPILRNNHESQISAMTVNSNTESKSIIDDQIKQAFKSQTELSTSNYEQASSLNNSNQIDHDLESDYDSDDMPSPPQLTSIVGFNTKNIDSNSLQNSGSYLNGKVGSSNKEKFIDTNKLEAKPQSLSNFNELSTNSASSFDNLGKSSNHFQSISSNSENSAIYEDTFQFINNKHLKGPNNAIISNPAGVSSSSGFNSQYSNKSFSSNTSVNKLDQQLARKNFENYSHRYIDETVLMDPALFADDMLNENDPEHESPLANKNKVPAMNLNQPTKPNTFNGKSILNPLRQDSVSSNRSRNAYEGNQPNSNSSFNGSNKYSSGLSRVRSSDELSPLQPDRIVKSKIDSVNSVNNASRFHNSEHQSNFNAKSSLSIQQPSSSSFTDRLQNEEFTNTRSLSALEFSMSNDPSVRLNSSFFSDTGNDNTNSNISYAFNRNEVLKNDSYGNEISHIPTNYPTSPLSSSINRPVLSSSISASTSNQPNNNNASNSSFDYSPLGADYSILSASTGTHADMTFDGTTSIYPDTVLLNMAASQAANERNNSS